MNVSICIASYRFPRPQFVLSLAGLLTRSLRQRVIYNGNEVYPDITTLVAEGFSVDIAREELVKSAMQGLPDYLLFLDDDHEFPDDALFRLAAHDLPLVGCNYPRRISGASVSAASNVSASGYQPIEPKAEGLGKVDVLGFGVCLVKAQVFRDMPAPWFMGGTDEADATFCSRLRNRGIQPHVDHSIKVGHIAETVLRFS